MAGNPDDYDAAKLDRLQSERDDALASGDQAKADLLGREIAEVVERGDAVREADLKLRSNERIRYTATLINNVATTVVSLGIAAPLLGVFVPGSPYSDHLSLLGEVSGACALIATVLHIIVRWMLRGLRA